MKTYYIEYNIQDFGNQKTEHYDSLKEAIYQGNDIKTFEGVSNVKLVTYLSFPCKCFIKKSTPIEDINDEWISNQLESNNMVLVEEQIK